MTIMYRYRFVGKKRYANAETRIERRERRCSQSSVVRQDEFSGGKCPRYHASQLFNLSSPPPPLKATGILATYTMATITDIIPRETNSERYDDHVSLVCRQPHPDTARNTYISLRTYVQWIKLRTINIILLSRILIICDPLYIHVAWFNFKFNPACRLAFMSPQVLIDAMYTH